MIFANDIGWSNMQIISSYSDYLGLLNRSFIYEDLKSLQGHLVSLYHRDKSEFINYQRVNKQLIDIQNINCFDLPEYEQVELKNELEAYIQQWNSYLDCFRSVNQLIILGLYSYPQDIQPSTLKMIHYTQQTMSLNELKQVQVDLLNALQQDLKHLSVDFSHCMLKQQREDDDKLKRLAREEAERERIEREKVQKAKEEAERERIEREKAQKAKEEAERNPLHVNLDIHKKICKSCNKVYDMHYSVCLRCGQTLTQQIL